MTSFRAAFSLTPESVQKVIGEKTKQVMVYGFEFAKYKEVSQALASGAQGIQKVFGTTLGAEEDPEWRTTVEGTVVETFPTNSTHDSRQSVARECKSAITALIYENYKRKKRGLAFIPLLFCVEYLEDPKKGVLKTTAERVAGKERQLNELFTHSELRRVYKHCKEFERSEEPELRELAQVAQETLKFVRVEKVADRRYTLTAVRPIWEEGDWETVWQKRLERNPEVREENSQRKENKWREQLLKRVKEFNRSFNQRNSLK